ncbi:MAG TPA: glutamine-hydrolyzing carbamoyl-phosphate synthase small subunit [Anaerolineales bacterium]|nr:glutamine-hydrolyzing carbamoyl-phosphate synthase small subunit [Anaerolineales bacterium]
MPLATLTLEDGTILTGDAFGAQTDTVFELVFNTSMTGYQEIITDPSYAGQGVLFTVPHIGNVGINVEDYESSTPQVSGVVIRSLSPVVSNWRSARTLDDWLTEHGVPGISGVDTRALTHKLREQGTLKAALSTRGTDAQTLLQRAHAWPGLDGRDMVKEVTCPEPYVWEGDAGEKWVRREEVISDEVMSKGVMSKEYRVVLYDFGAKRNIVRHLAAWGAEVRVVPADYPAEEVLKLNPDGVMLSNGPGDPAGLPYAVAAVEQLIASGTPVFGICLGHQLIGRALGGETTRLKFGHHGGNHPVQDLRTRQVQVTSQNHNYTVVPETLNPDKVEITHLSLNDGSVEGLRLKEKPVYSVQFHPEAAPGPHDGHGIFGDFFEAMQKRTL